MDRLRLTAASLFTLALVGCLDSGNSPGAADMAPLDGGPGADMDRPDGSPAEARLVVASRDGKLASLDLAAPFTVRATADLQSKVTSVRCRAGRCLVVHPSPFDTVHVVSASDLALLSTIELEGGADPRDVALVDDRTAIIGQHGRSALIEVDLVTGAKAPIDLRLLADDDNLPETNRLAHCGRRVYVQLRRTLDGGDEPSSLPAAIAVVDLDRTGADRLVDVDPNVSGVQGITLADRPAFDMPIDCAASALYVAEPRPLMKGGGGYEKVDLVTYRASDLPLDTSAEVGGFEIVDDAAKYWLITHSTTGPGPSSHLNFHGGQIMDTHNTFAREHVDDLAADRGTDLLYFPDPCSPEMYGGCDPGVHVFHLRTGERAQANAVKLAFPPIEIAVSR